MAITKWTWSPESSKPASLPSRYQGLLCSRRSTGVTAVELSLLLELLLSSETLEPGLYLSSWFWAQSLREWAETSWERADYKPVLVCAAWPGFAFHWIWLVFACSVCVLHGFWGVLMRFRPSGLWWQYLCILYTWIKQDSQPQPAVVPPRHLSLT